MGLFSFTQEIAMDLGTANSIIIHNDKIVVDEPSVVAIENKTDKLTITKNTYSIHHFHSSWISDEEKQFASKIKEYEKTHSKLQTIIYKNILECEIKYGSINPLNIIRIIAFKINKKRIERLK